MHAVYLAHKIIALSVSRTTCTEEEQVSPRLVRLIRSINIDEHDDDRQTRWLIELRFYVALEGTQYMTSLRRRSPEPRSVGRSPGVGGNERDQSRPEAGLDDDWLLTSCCNRTVHQRMRLDEVESLIGHRATVVGAHLYRYSMTNLLYRISYLTQHQT